MKHCSSYYYRASTGIPEILGKLLEVILEILQESSPSAMDVFFHCLQHSLAHSQSCVLLPRGFSLFWAWIVKWLHSHKNPGKMFKGEYDMFLQIL